jgi:hypothetical protein
VANAKGGIEKKCVDLIALIILVHDTRKNFVGKRMEKDLFVFTNYSKVLINDGKATLAALNRLCGVKNNIFSRTRVPRKINSVVMHEVDRDDKGPHEEDTTTPKRLGNEISTTKSKILTHFLKGKTTFMPLETIMTIHGELEYIEGLMKLARRHKNEEVQQVTHVVTILVVPIIKQVCVNKKPHR